MTGGDASSVNIGVFMTAAVSDYRQPGVFRVVERRYSKESSGARPKDARHGWWRMCKRIK